MLCANPYHKEPQYRGAHSDHLYPYSRGMEKFQISKKTSSLEIFLKNLGTLEPRSVSRLIIEKQSVPEIEQCFIFVID